MTDRLNPTDEALYDASSTLGSSRIIQVLWRFSSEVPTSTLRDEWNRLNRSRLSRCAIPSRMPGARRKWVTVSNEEPLREYPDKLVGQDLIGWIDEQVRTPLPAGSNALWRLAATRYRHGSLVSLTVPHFRSDGLGVFAAFEDRQPREARSRFAPANFLGSDMGDALSQTILTITGATRWGFNLMTDEQGRARLAAALDTRSSVPTTGSEPRFFSSAIFDLDATSWHETARARGGTANSLFVEIAANLARARLPQDTRTTIRVGIPVSLRRSDADDRANALIVVTLNAPAGAPQYEDLRRTHRDTKAVLQRSDELRATLVPEPVWHMLPRRYANRLKAPGAQQTDVVASNFGRVPDAVTQFAGQKADSIALRTMNVPGLVPEKARLRASLCMSQTHDHMTVTVTAMPDEFGDVDTLRRLVTNEFAAWGLQPECWC